MLRFFIICALGSTCLYPLCGCRATAVAAPDPSPSLQPIPVTLATAGRRRIELRLELGGDVVAHRKTAVVSRMDGAVTSLRASPTSRRDGRQAGIELQTLQAGHYFDEGQVIAVLDSHEQTTLVGIARADLQRTEAELAQLQLGKRDEEIAQLTALVEKARSEYEQEVRDYQRVRGLVESVQRSERERSATRVLVRKADLRFAEAQLLVAHNGPTEQEIAIQQADVARAKIILEQAERQLSYTSIRAPHGGWVTGLHVTEGAYVKAGDPICELVDLRSVMVQVHVPEKHANDISLFDPAEVHTGGAVRLPARVVAVRPQVDRQTRMVDVRVRVDEVDGELWPGQYVKVVMETSRRAQPMLCVPTQAVTFRNGQPLVFVYRRGVVVETPLELGTRNEHLTQIRTGLVEGDQVILGQGELLSDGMAVTAANGADLEDVN